EVNGQRGLTRDGHLLDRHTGSVLDHDIGGAVDEVLAEDLDRDRGAAFRGVGTDLHQLRLRRTDVEVEPAGAAWGRHGHGPIPECRVGVDHEVGFECSGAHHRNVPHRHANASTVTPSPLTATTISPD